MSQQAQNDFYESEEEMALDYAAAVNEEIKDLFAAGADIVQIDEPYMQAMPDKARQFGLKALNRALDGVQGETAVHLCFGYAAMVANRPSEYQFLTELADAPVNCISSKPRSLRSIAPCLPSLPTKRSSWVCWIFPPTKWRRRKKSPPASAARFLISARIV